MSDFDNVKWEPIAGADRKSAWSGELPHATHEGKFQLRVYRLNDGRTIINAEDLEKFFAAVVTR